MEEQELLETSENAGSSRLVNAIIKLKLNLATPKKLINTFIKINQLKVDTVKDNETKKSFNNSEKSNNFLVLIVQKELKHFFVPIFRDKISKKDIPESTFTMATVRAILKGEDKIMQLPVVPILMLENLRKKGKMPIFSNGTDINSVIDQINLNSDEVENISSCELSNKIDDAEIRIFNQVRSSQPDEHSQGDSSHTDEHSHDLENKLDSENVEFISKRESKVMSEKTKGDNFKTRIKIPIWNEKDDGLDWISSSLFLLKLSSSSYSDKDQISLLVSSINNNAMRIKLISELRLVEEDQLDLKTFERIFRNMVTRDCLTYKEGLKTYKYNSKASLNEMYTEIYLLVVRSTGLDEIKDKCSLEKLTINAFLEKLPKPIRRQLVTHEAKNGEELVAAAERCRSYSRVYLGEDMDESMEVNHTETNQVSFDKKQIKCTHCSKNGHLEKDCFAKKRENSKQGDDKSYKGGNGQITRHCFYCEEKGHVVRNCRTMKADREFVKNSESKTVSKEDSQFYIDK